MKLTISHSHRIKQGLHQTQRLQSVIEFSGLLSVPDVVYSVVDGSVAHNPDSVEQILQARSKDMHPGDQAGRVEAIYDSFFPSVDGSGGLPKGKIIAPNVSFLEDHLPSDYVAHITPDVVYIGRTDLKPEMVFSDHLQGRMELRLDIDENRFPETAKLVRKLRAFDHWKRGELRKIYGVMGNQQREFLAGFDETRYNICGVNSIADMVNLHETTVYRILANRWVEARNIQGDVKTMRSKDLCTTKNDVLRLASCQRINQILQEEWESGNAYSDQKIANQVPSIVRRTVAKYRNVFGVPNTSERQVAYRTARIPFKIIL